MRLLTFILIFCVTQSGFGQKISGVNWVGIRSEFPAHNFDSLANVGANWVALNPYAFTDEDEGIVTFDAKMQWWGETTEGTIAQIEMAHQRGLKVMIKPHLWEKEEGWAGDIYNDDPEILKQWFAQFSSYIVHHASIAEKHKAELFCIGTETRLVAKRHPDWFEGLIASVRSVYSGPLVYAANWDNYQNITFWDKLDYIGVDAYWPLSEKENPTNSELRKAWQPIKKDLQKVAERYKKPLLFTEFGYRSMTGALGKHWELPDGWTNRSQDANMNIQVEGYQALFQEFWTEGEWFGGGFLWKWFPQYKSAGGGNNNGFTPQNKPVERNIRFWFLAK